jgi:amphi-Trp domain-containing protein
MSDGTIHESDETRNRRGVSAFFRRIARALGRGEPVPATDDQTVTVDVPAEPELEVEVEREAGEAVLEVELSWPDEEGATIETDANASLATFELYEDSAGDHRWRLRHRNGNIIADGGQGYASKQKARQGMRSVRQNCRGAPLEDVEN